MCSMWQDVVKHLYYALTHMVAIAGCLYAEI
jgi:hypothetical protein